MSIKPSQRVAALPPYLIVELDKRKRQRRAAGADLIDLSIGAPDQPPHEFIVATLKAAADKPENHRYTLTYGYPEFRQRAAEFFLRRYGVSLDPQREILTLIGSKEGLGHLPLALVDPGRGVLVPNPGYPAYRPATLLAGGVVHDLPLEPERGWLPDFDRIPGEVAHNAVLMFLNYPNNPTGACADREFFERAIHWARRHGVVLVHDAAYNEMYFDDQRPPSVLELPGAREVAVEFHSTSKTFNMTGWRLGFAAGNADVLAALARVKANLDSGQFAAVQAAAAAAYAGFERPEFDADRRMYHERSRVLVEGLRELGYRVEQPRATFYVWAGLPDGAGSLEAANALLEQADVAVVPGVAFGTRGEGYLRFATTVSLERTREALERMRKVDLT